MIIFQLLLINNKLFTKSKNLEIEYKVSKKIFKIHRQDFSFYNQLRMGFKKKL